MKRLTTLLFAIISLVLVFALTGCNSGGNFTEQSYSSGDSKIESVTIDVIDREITVSVSDDNKVHIGYFESEKEFYKISVSENNVLKMEFSNNKEWSDFIGTKPSQEFRKINLKIPSALLSCLTITTTNEDIKLSPIAVSDSISLFSNGGSIEFEKLVVGNELILETENGNIQGTVIGSYDVFSIACKIKKGDCNLPLLKTDGEKSLKATCNNGNIKIDFIKA